MHIMILKTQAIVLDYYGMVLWYGVYVMVWCVCDGMVCI